MIIFVCVREREYCVCKFVIVRGETNIFNYKILTDDLFAMKSALPCSLHKCTRLIHSLRSLKRIDNVNAERMLFSCAISHSIYN